MKAARSAVNALLSPLGLKMVRADSLHFRPSTVPYGVSLATDLGRLAGNRPLRVIFDVGANVGQFAESAATDFPDAAVWSFEPVPATFEGLKATAARCPNIKPFPLAFGPADARQTINLYKDSTMSSLADKPIFEESFARPVSSVEVTVRTLDGFCKEQGVTAIDLLKVDTEGFDLQVFRGATGLLGSGAVRFLTTEFYRPLAVPGRQGGGLSEAAELLAGFGFEFVTAYTDYVIPEKRFFGVHNALFAHAR
jgi:FkbM family methyltransferase